MKTLASISVLSLLAGSALGQASTYASGIQHTPLGASSLTPNGRGVKVCCLGSTGQDGVSVQLASGWGGDCTVDMTPLLSSSSTMRVRYRGWDGLIYGNHRVTGTGGGGGGGGAIGTSDFSGGGATAVQYTVADSTGHVLGQGTVSGPTIDWNVNGPCGPGETPIWTWKWGYDAQYDCWHYMLTLVGCVSNVHVGGTTIPDSSYARTITFTPIYPVNDPPLAIAEAIDITVKDLPVLTTLGADMAFDSVSYYGEPNAHLSEVCDDASGTCTRTERRVRNGGLLGSSGQDGVEIPASGRVADFHADLPTLPGPGQTLTYDTIDSDGDMLARCTLGTLPGTAVKTITPDYSGLGSHSFQVDCLDDSGTTIATYALANGKSFPYASLNPCPKGMHAIYVNVGPKHFFVGCEFNVDPTGMYGPPHSGVTQMVFTPLDVTSNRVAQSAHFFSTNMDSFELGNPGVTPICPADFNGDGFADFFDFSDFVTCFEGGACPPGTSADFNGDGFPDFFDFSDFVTAFEAGC